MRLFVRACLLSVAALMVAPALGSAAAKFGADLRNPGGSVVQPANAGHTCEESGDGAIGGPCTRMPYDFDSDLAAKAPKDGKLKALKLVALNPGSFRLYLGRATKLDGPGKGRLTRRGPRIAYEGDDDGTPGYDIETFRLGLLKVKKGERMALKGDAFSAETCNGGNERALLFDPPLGLSDPLSKADARDDSCTYLLQLIYK
jgi:hypothetical protein